MTNGDQNKDLTANRFQMGPKSSKEDDNEGGKYVIIDPKQWKVENEYVGEETHAVLDCAVCNDEVANPNRVDRYDDSTFWVSKVRQYRCVCEQHIGKGDALVTNCDYHFEGDPLWKEEEWFEVKEVLPHKNTKSSVSDVPENASVKTNIVTCSECGFREPPSTNPQIGERIYHQCSKCGNQEELAARHISGN
ncbi:hypothetical protein ACT4ML_19880 [Natrinema sp. LN54]|uniref:hypothetical protein n=1 Tax=Natrinema sp. LN54 TaxID=3458705 RepID=UPI0040373AED